MVVSACKSGRLDHPTLNLLKEVKIDVPIVQINQFSDYVFNEDLYKLKDWVLADFMEQGANSWDCRETLLFGHNAIKFDKANTWDWIKFDEFVQANPPKLYLKRELLKNDRTSNVHPINFPCFWQASPPVSKEEFESRPIDVFNSWGYSHELRRHFHGEVFINAVHRNRAVIDNYSHLEEELKDERKKWVSVFTPHHSRLPMDYVLTVQGMSKLSVSLPGAGLSCFRHAEAPLNSVMVMRADPLKYSYDWVHNENCVMFPVGEDMDSIRGITGAKEAVETIEEALQNPNLYDIYREGVANCEKYKLNNYVKNYIEPLIKLYL